MRIALSRLLTQADIVQELPHPPASFAATQITTVSKERLGNEIGHAHARIQRSIGVLKDHLNALGQSGAPTPQSLAFKTNRPALGPKKTDDGAQQRRLAGAALPHQTQNLARRQVHVDPIQGQGSRLSRAKAKRQIFDLQEWRAHRASSSATGQRSQRPASSSTSDGGCVSQES